MNNWWPIPWTNPPAGSNSAVIRLRNGRQVLIYDDEGRRKMDGAKPWKRWMQTRMPADPVTRYEVREILPGGRHSTKYERVETLLELRATLTAMEQEPYSPE